MVVPPCRRLWDPRMSRLPPGPRRSPGRRPGTPTRRKILGDPHLVTLLIGTHTWVNHLRGPQDVARGPPDGIPPIHRSGLVDASWRHASKWECGPELKDRYNALVLRRCARSAGPVELIWAANAAELALSRLVRIEWTPRASSDEISCGSCVNPMFRRDIFLDTGTLIADLAAESSWAWLAN